MKPSDTATFYKRFPSEQRAPLDQALLELRRMREALDLATICVEQAVKLAQVNVSPQPFYGADIAEGRDVHLVAKAPAKPQPWPERLKHGFAADLAAPYDATAKKAASNIEDAYAAAARELYGKTGTFVVPPDASKCRHAQLANGAMPVPFCEVCGSFDLRCAIGAPGTSREGFGPAPVERRSTADLCAETAKPIRIRPSEDDCA